MPDELIITNGDSTAGLLVAAGLSRRDNIIIWRDILHEGAVPLTEDFATLSKIRGQFISENYWAGTGIQPSDVFADRDVALTQSNLYEKVSLWFEHDLYDQLQLIQILDWFAQNPLPNGNLHLVQADTYLGEQKPEEIGRFQAIEKPVTASQLALAKKAWSAFRQPKPVSWAELLNDDLDALPFLPAAVVRMLEELPAPGTGLSRTETQVLVCASGATKTTVEILKETWAAEEAIFMGDWSIFKILDRLALSPAPLLTGLNGGPFGYDEDFNGTTGPGSRRDQYCNSLPKPTELGTRILDGKDDWRHHTAIDRWWGGTHLTNDNLWRWDRQTQLLTAPV